MGGKASLYIPVIHEKIFYSVLNSCGEAVDIPEAFKNQPLYLTKASKLSPQLNVQTELRKSLSFRLLDFYRNALFMLKSLDNACCRSHLRIL